MALGNSTMTYDQLGGLAANLLHKAFIESTRTLSKQLFRRLNDGETLPVTKLELEDDQSLQLMMRLDCGEYRGELNYSKFRDSIVAILQALVEALKSENPLQTFQEKDAAGEPTHKVLLGTTGPTQHGDDINVLMCALTPSPTEPRVLVELLYMNPDQFVAEGATSS